MSIEPTCDYCGASDKNRCRTQAQADACRESVKEKLTRDVRPDHVLPKAELDALPTMTLDRPLSRGSVEVKTHQSGQIGKLLITVRESGAGVKGALLPAVRFLLSPEDIDPFIDTLLKAKTYTTQGKL